MAPLKFKLDSNTAFVSDPLSGNKRYMQSGVGFRGDDYNYQDYFMNNGVPYQPFSYNDAVPQPTVAAWSDDGDDNYNMGEGPYGVTDLRPVAGGFGYKETEYNPMIGLINAFTPFNFDNPEYGLPGTYDHRGNIFGADGISRSPVTGEVKGYKDIDTYKNTLINNYNTSRAAGKNMFDSVFGSPEGSMDPTIGGMSRWDRMKGLTPATRDHSLYNTYALLNRNTYGDTYGMFTDEYDELGGLGIPLPEVTYRGLGLDPNAVGGMKNKDGLTGKIGTGFGDVYLTHDNPKSPHVVTDDGSLMSKDGTLVSTTNPWTGEKVSLFTDGSTAGSNQIIADWDIPYHDSGVPNLDAKETGGWGRAADYGIDYTGSWNDLSPISNTPAGVPEEEIGVDPVVSTPVTPTHVVHDTGGSDDWSGNDDWGGGQDHGPSDHGGDTSVGSDASADESIGSSTDADNVSHDFGGDWGSFWSKGGRIPSVQAGGK